GLPDGRERHVAVVAWPAGPDLHATVYFNQRSRLERPPESIDPGRLASALTERLRAEMQRVAAGLDPTVEQRADLLGRVEARTVAREPEAGRALTTAQRERLEPSDASSAAIVVTLQRGEQPEADRREPPTVDRAAFEPERPAE